MHALLEAVLNPYLIMCFTQTAFDRDLGSFTSGWLAGTAQQNWALTRCGYHYMPWHGVKHSP